MVKFLCCLFLAGLAFQANAYTTEYPEAPKVEDLPDILNPSYWISKVVDVINPLNYIPNIKDVINPLYWIEKMVNPLGLLPDFLNPVTYIRKGLDIINPFKYIPNPFKFITGITDLIPGLGGSKCKHELDRGSRCDDKKPLQNRYYYDQATGCRPFMYRGCGGNKNNFESLQECEKACGKPNDHEDHE